MKKPCSLILTFTLVAFLGCDKIVEYNKDSVSAPTENQKTESIRPQKVEVPPRKWRSDEWIDYIARIITRHGAPDGQMNELDAHLKGDGWTRRDTERNHPILGEKLPHAIYTNPRPPGFEIIVIYDANGTVRAINWK